MRKRSTIFSFLKYIRAAVFPALLLVLTASTSWGAPTITAVEPPDSSSPAASVIPSATFSEYIDPTTITNGSFTVSKSVKIKAIAAGSSHTLVLKSDGTIAAWGGGYKGKTSVPLGLSGVTAIAAGTNDSFALKNDGTVVAWGEWGQNWVPTGLSGVVAISTGYWHTLALKNDGTIIGWGGNENGQISVPLGLSGIVSISAGDLYSLALKNDGTVVGWGDNTYGQRSVPTSLAGVTAISAGKMHSLALKKDGTVVAWGANYSGQRSVPSGLSGVTAISAGSYHSLALKADGTVIGWGDNSYSQISIPIGLTGVVAISAGDYYSLALKNDGTIVGWGDDACSQSSVPSDLSGVAGIEAGENYSMALKNNGTVVAWGANSHGQRAVPPGLSEVAAISAGWHHSLAMKKDGSVVSWGSLNSVPTSLSGVVAISAGYDNSLALKNDGTVIVWGNLPPTIVFPSQSGIVAISSGWYHWLALKNDGTVVAWGDNSVGQSSVPQGLFDVVAISAGCNYSMALKKDGTVVAWGQNYWGEISVPPGLSNVVAISAGHSNSLALKSDGTVVAWSASGIVPADLSGVVSISGRGNHSLAMKNDGTVVAWGNNTYGQSNVPKSPYKTIVPGSVIYDQTANTATITPSVLLEPGFTYIGTVATGVRNVSGEYLAADFNWSFSPVQTPTTIALSNLNQPYDGTPKAVTAATDPAGLTVSITYNGSTTPPTAVGSYIVVATVNDSTYAGSATAVLTISNPVYTIGIYVGGGHGSISCDSPVIMGGNSICSIIPDANYHLATFTDNNVDKLATVSSNNYTIGNVVADHTIQGTFAVNLIANAGPTQTLNCSGPTGAQVILDGSASTGATFYAWSGPFGSASGVNPTVTIPWGTHTITLTVTDWTGKSALSSVIIAVTDNVPPLVNVVSNGARGNNDWFVSAIDMGLNAVDSCSSIREIRYTLDNNAEQAVIGATAGFRIVGDGSHTVTYRAIDNAGNEVGNSIIFKIDGTAPAITGAVLTQPNVNGWYNGNATVHFSATDALSGIASLTPDTAVTNEGAGQLVTGTAVDMAGNQTTYSVTGINVDKTAPSLVISGITNDATYNLGLVPTPEFGAVDAISGVATSGASLTGGDAQGLGQFTYTVSATDKAGNAAVTSVTYTVNATTTGTITLISQLTATGMIDQQTAVMLNSSLTTAMQFYASGNSIAGDEMMGVFINQVNAPGKSISPEITAQLINAANYIIAHN